MKHNIGRKYMHHPIEKHTPTPWYTAQWGEEQGNIRAGNPDGTNIHIAGCEGRPFGTNQANAEFIVRACNSHDELVEVLKDLYDDLRQGALPTDLSPIEAVLAKAEGREG